MRKHKKRDAWHLKGMIEALKKVDKKALVNPIVKNWICGAMGCTHYFDPRPGRYGIPVGILLQRLQSLPCTPRQKVYWGFWPERVSKPIMMWFECGHTSFEIPIEAKPMKVKRKVKKHKGMFQKGHRPWNKGKKTGANKFNKFVSRYFKDAAAAYNRGKRRDAKKS